MKDFIFRYISVPSKIINQSLTPIERKLRMGIGEKHDLLVQPVAGLTLVLVFFQVAAFF